MEDVLKQAKIKALNLLTDMDRTQEQLRQKLKQKGYPDIVVEQAISYVKSFGYIDDERYARNYVEIKKKTKSKQEISALLSQKGIRREVIAQALELSYSSEDARDAIRHLAEKKHYFDDNCTDRDKEKIYAYLLRKGFRHDDIRQVIQVSFGNA